MSENNMFLRQFMRRFHQIGHLRGYGGLRMLVLYILSEGPKNGAELMDAIDVMSHGHWRPSPGSVYPLLSKAVDENLIVKREDRKYELTAAGYEEISMFTPGNTSKTESVESILTDIDSNLSYLEDLPGDKLAPYAEKLGMIGLKLDRIHETLKSCEKEA